ncbi:LamB/YcsF family protein [Cnuibacter physcomitrellae]|uniref:LamB/YcsF family protein n=1 Tax=Cnuibacter physcomitrellae TaxID=1619308 RepID=UPI0021761B38|nr:5-oxoprolinase subunit PxpA [Cnuibacter physcomitrellae]MCS5496941.1 LamB/YcsF family protein [Cnuibacter physcomitrellae]
MTMIDLNADLGESFGAWRMGDDARMLDVVTSANVACGFHAGDPAGILETLTAAADRGVSVGAHVGYPDLRGFGRRTIDVSPVDLTADTVYQIGALQALARAAGTRVAYVKPHGALYNRIVHEDVQARAVVDGILAADDSLPLVGLPGSVTQRIAESVGLSFVAEAYADRGYRPDGTLVPRSEPGAVLHDADAIARRMVGLVVDGSVEAVDGSVVTLSARTICVHGDTAGSVGIAVALRSALERAGVTLSPFASAAA